jgi:DNA adenine methylase
MTELDPAVADVWDVMVNQTEGPRLLAQRILTFRMKDQLEEWLSATFPTGHSEDKELVRLRAFQTLLRNRVARGGILAPGAGVAKRGERDKGIGQRWYPETLGNRILALEQYRHRLSFERGDGLVTIGQYALEGCNRDGQQDQEVPSLR